ncbi:MAG TPA: hypothetical protein VFP60_07585 [Pseudolabrys sp.]|nr:hypothetical protein [Pseudolabrys sp.]
MRTPTAARLSVAVVAFAGFVLSVLIFYPGIMTYDAKYVYADISKHVLGDWQSPVMTVLWAWIDPLAPGPASMFLLMAALYWIGFAVVGLALASRSGWLAVLSPGLAFMPPALVFVGILWRDVLFAVTWLTASAIAFAAPGRVSVIRISMQGLGLLLCVFGVLLRPNALIAAPILATYIIWPARFDGKRLLMAFVPAIVIFFGLVQFVYYGVLGATRQHPLHSVMVFDLGGISHFSKENQFPVSWNDAEMKLLLDGCYQPTQWDIYWRLQPCDFVMRKVEKEEKLFGTPALTKAWILAIVRHPIAYLEHRAAFMLNFLAGENLTMWVVDIEKPTETVFADRPLFSIVENIHEALKTTPLFRAGSWLIACVAACLLCWRARNTPEGAFVIGVCGSAAVYVLSLFLVGVASDFRYGYWSVLATIAGAVVGLSLLHLGRGELRLRKLREPATQPT